MDDTAIPTVSTPAELAQVIEGRTGSHVGVVVSPARRSGLFDALAELLSGTNRYVFRMAGQSFEEFVANLQQCFGGRLAPKPVSSATPMQWRDRIIAQLHAEQIQAQQHVEAAKLRGETADPAEREVAGWLASGLRDLLADPITNAQFLSPGRGCIARMAAGEHTVRFAETDFLRPDGIRFMEATRPAQNILTKLSLTSTNQFRASAARLLNRILEHLTTPSAAPENEQPLLDRLAVALKETGEQVILLVDDLGALSWVDAAVAALGGSIRIITAADDARSFAAVSSVPIEIYRLAEPTLPTPADRFELWSSLHDSCLRVVQLGTTVAATLIERGVLGAEEIQDCEKLERDLLALPTNPDIASAAANQRITDSLAALRNKLQSAWHGWFDRQLAAIDAEELLRQLMAIKMEESLLPEAMPGHATALQAVAEALANSQSVTAGLPRSAAEFAAAEAVIAEMQRLDRLFRTQRLTREEEGMAFDAAVAAGGATLDQLTEGVIWWLRAENRDWDNYRIVRIK